jgi:hypothetical protein
MHPPSPTRRAARWRWLAVACVAALALTGCDFATGTVRTLNELRQAGIRNPDLRVNNRAAELTYDSGVGPLQRAVEQDRAAQVIWENLPFELQVITVRSRGDGLFDTPRSYPRTVLEARFGPRPPGLDRSPGDVGRRVAIGLAIGGLIVLLAVILIIVLVVRATRRRPAVQPAGGWPGGQQPGYGQPPGYGPPGWPPQGQPGGWGQPGGQAWPPPGAERWDDWPSGAPEPGAPQPPAPDRSPSDPAAPGQGPAEPAAPAGGRPAGGATRLERLPDDEPSDDTARLDPPPRDQGPAPPA